MRHIIYVLSFADKQLVSGLCKSWQEDLKVKKQKNISKNITWFHNIFEIKNEDDVILINKSVKERTIGQQVQGEMF